MSYYCCNKEWPNDSTHMHSHGLPIPNNPSEYAQNLNKRISTLEVALREAKDTLFFYSEMATKRNHEFIFDDENSSRGEIYEKYLKHGIGDLGVKAAESLNRIAEILKEGEK